MRHYELLFVVKPTLTDEEVAARVDFVKQVLETNGAEIAKVDSMGVRKLAYEIQKHARGHYFVVYFKSEPSIIKEVLRNLRLAEDVIRFLNVKFESKSEIANWEKLVAGGSKKEAQPAKEEKQEESTEPKAESAE